MIFSYELFGTWAFQEEHIEECASACQLLNNAVIGVNVVHISDLVVSPRLQLQILE